MKRWKKWEKIGLLTGVILSMSVTVCNVAAGNIVLGKILGGITLLGLLITIAAAAAVKK